VYEIATEDYRLFMKKITLRLLISVSTLLAAAFALSACSTPREAAPEASYVLLSGAKESTQSMKGKVYIVNFWATSCAVCVKEMPEVASTYSKFAKQGFDVLAVATKDDPPAYVVNFAETRKLPFKVAIDNTGAVAKAFGQIKVTPTSYLIDRQGRIAKRWVGVPDFVLLHAEIEALL
jgi:peroxiredoxin